MRKKNLLLHIEGSYKNLQAAIVLTKKHCFQVLSRTKDLEETGWGSGDLVSSVNCEQFLLKVEMDEGFGICLM